MIERGLTPATASGYVGVVGPFVTSRSQGQLGLDTLTAADVTGYLAASCPGRAIGSAQMIVCALRSLLNWLHLTGTIPESLATAVPLVASWKLAGAPEGSAGQVRAFLAACDRRTRTGGRNDAILLLLARLGLRAGEVAALGLDDIDWRHGEIEVQGKGNRTARLPLQANVGAAITAYLRRGRPDLARIHRSA